MNFRGVVIVMIDTVALSESYPLKIDVDALLANGWQPRYNKFTGELRQFFNNQGENDPRVWL